MAKELTTYAQNREDLFIYAMLHDIKKGFYVDVGANHEELHSVTKLFYKLGWKGINIEPNRKLVNELKQKRSRDKNLQLGISNKDGKMTFREYPDFDGLSTLSDEIKKNNTKRNFAYIDYDIPVKTLANIFRKQNVSKIDFLKIDVEGHELAVLEGNDWTKFRPRLIVIEGTDKEKTLPYLNDIGYRVEFFDGLNYYLVEDNDIKTTIHTYAGTVLTRGISTRTEMELSNKISTLESDILKIAMSINEGIGIKKSALSFVKSVRRKFKLLLNKPTVLESE
jgi:FkbM family methyltransferase